MYNSPEKYICIDYSVSQMREKAGRHDEEISQDTPLVSGSDSRESLPMLQIPKQGER